MFARYLRRELSGRRKQTAIIAIALALAIALVIVVNALSAGVRDAQKAALATVYGVGTDITVTKAPAAPTAGAQPGQRFDVNGQSGTGSSTSVSQSRLISGRGASTFAGTSADTVKATTGVQSASAALSLMNITLNGQLTQTGTGSGSAPTAAPTAPAPSGEGQTATGQGQRGPGGSFGVNSFSVLGIDGSASTVGPLASASVSQGRALGTQDVGQHNAVVDSSYATTASLTLGGTVNVGGTDFTIVGIVSATGSESETAANVYVPLDVAQTLSSQAGVVSSVYVKASSSDQLAAVKAALQKALPDETVNTQDDLAANVSGSLANASSLVSGLGLWLSVAVLVAAFLLAALLTLSGVSRRTREFGTLKAIGWRNSAIVRQVAGESLVQSGIGAVGGIAVGLIAVVLLNIFAPTLSASAGVGRGFGGQGGAGQAAGQAARQAAGQAAQSGGPGQGPGGFGGGSAAQVVLGAPITPAIVLIAVGIAIAGGLIAGIVGGWRAARLQPAEALRSVA
ncbi:ABC transporter permease [Sinomonas sp. ASV486]|uniref:ABC transporter permease n=1 Tax=Sinomonas sp. ASV486 TaxID=3051170 RepID=UPI0027DBE878|nr:ABC transporter permease [Sinomonas sp. ASV486]MDQ4490070.1 ABC transporter permease [Sinomonas sp. ASV486]